MNNEIENINNDGSANLSSMANILKIITNAFKIPKKPVSPMPPPLIMLGAKSRTGISANEVAAKIIARQSEAGLIVGDAYADGPNTAEAMEAIRVEEIVKAILLNCKVEVVIPPGVAVQTLGIGNLGAPVISQGVTTTMAVGNGIIR